MQVVRTGTSEGGEHRSPLFVRICLRLLAISAASIGLLFLATATASADDDGEEPSLVSGVSSTLDSVVKTVVPEAAPAPKAQPAKSAEQPPPAAPKPAPLPKAVAPVVEAVEPVAKVVEPVTDVVAPVVEPVTEAVAPVVETVAPVKDAVVAPVVDVVTPVTGALVAPVVDAVVVPVVDDIVTPLIETVVVPIVDGVEPLTNRLVQNVLDVTLPVVVPVPLVKSIVRPAAADSATAVDEPATVVAAAPADRTLDTGIVSKAPEAVVVASRAVQGAAANAPVDAAAPSPLVAERIPSATPAPGLDFGDRLSSVDIGSIPSTPGAQGSSGGSAGSAGGSSPLLATILKNLSTPLDNSVIRMVSDDSVIPSSLVSAVEERPG